MSMAKSRTLARTMLELGAVALLLAVPFFGCSSTTKDQQSAAEACVASGACAASADDGQRDADETDVDCGGSQSPKCPGGAVCNADVNCAEGSCISGVCAGPPSDPDAGAPAAPDCTLTNTCAPSGEPSPSDPNCQQGEANDPTLCPPVIF